MANRLTLTYKNLSKFLTQLTQDPNVSKAARLINISRNHIYRHKKEDQDFSDAWDEAVETSLDDLEAEARRRAYNGVPKYKLFKGKIIHIQAVDHEGQPMFEDDGIVPIMTPLIEYDYSDRMMELLLKAHREKFKDKVEHELKGGAILTITELKADK